MKYRISIERLVLDRTGLDRRDGAPVARALERELAARLVASGLPPVLAGARFRVVEAPPIDRMASSPAQLGAQVAGAVQRGLTENCFRGGAS